MTDEQFADVMTVLCEIRDVLRFLAAPPDEAPDDRSAPCGHPEEHRLDLGTLREIQWTCRDCGYVHHERRR